MAERTMIDQMAKIVELLTNIADSLVAIEIELKRQGRRREAETTRQFHADNALPDARGEAG